MSRLFTLLDVPPPSTEVFVNIPFSCPQVTHRNIALAEEITRDLFVDFKTAQETKIYQPRRSPSVKLLIAMRHFNRFNPKESLVNLDASTRIN